MSKPITVGDIAAAIEPEAWEAYEAAPTNPETGDKSLENQYIWKINSSLDAAERVVQLLKDNDIGPRSGKKSELPPKPLC